MSGQFPDEPKTLTGYQPGPLERLIAAETTLHYVREDIRELRDELREAIKELRESQRKKSTPPHAAAAFLTKGAQQSIGGVIGAALLYILQVVIGAQQAPAHEPPKKPLQEQR